MEKRKLILALAEEIQHLIYQLYQNEPNNIAFESFGLLDGKAIVENYLQVNEYGLALEHIIYMVDESGIEVETRITTILEKLENENNKQN